MSTAWVMLAQQTNVQNWAQVGFIKQPTSPDPVKVHVFTNIHYFNPQTLQERNAFFWHYELNGPFVFHKYQVTTDRNYTWSFNFGDQQILFLDPSWGFQWRPDKHEDFGEVHDKTGDQLPGDRGATTKVWFQESYWSPNLSGLWYRSNFVWFVGHNAIQGDERTMDRLYAYSGNHFVIWDERCPNY